MCDADDEDDVEDQDNAQCVYCDDDDVDDEECVCLRVTMNYFFIVCVPRAQVMLMCEHRRVWSAFSLSSSRRRASTLRRKMFIRKDC